MTLKEAIEHAEEKAYECERKAVFESEYYHDAMRKVDSSCYTKSKAVFDKLLMCAAEYRQLAEWLKILKKAKFEYDEAWRIITHPTPDVNYADKQRAQVILDVFKSSLGRME